MKKWLMFAVVFASGNLSMCGSTPSKQRVVWTITNNSGRALGIGLQFSIQNITARAMNANETNDFYASPGACMIKASYQEAKDVGNNAAWKEMNILNAPLHATGGAVSICGNQKATITLSNEDVIVGHTNDTPPKPITAKKPQLVITTNN